MATAEQIREGIEAVRQWPYQNHRCVLLPYQENNTEVFPEEFLGRMYMKLRQEGTLHLAFPGMNVAHLNRFISYLANVRWGFYVCCLKTIKKPHPVGWGFLTEMDGDDGKRKASFAFGYFKELHGRREHVDLSMFLLKAWFTEYKVDQLFGTTLCVLPKFFNGVDAHLITLTPQRFEPYYQEWKCSQNERLVVA